MLNVLASHPLLAPSPRFAYSPHRLMNCSHFLLRGRICRHCGVPDAGVLRREAAGFNMQSPAPDLNRALELGESRFPSGSLVVHSWLTLSPKHRENERIIFRLIEFS